jgi:pyruvate,water dikinase
MTMSHVLTFGDPDGVHLQTSGGKGSSLSRLARAGFPVPPGFIVTSDAYWQFVGANDLQQQILSAVASIDFTDPDSVDEVTAKIRSTIAAAPIPEALAAAILGAYRKLGADTYVAVRSSGTAEDLAEASFAGQHDSYLDMRGEVDVLDAVRRCWASLWTARACAYRQQKGFDHAEVRLAVVVQMMISSEVSGVMFTANPLSTAVDEYVVNASWGLGEGIVSGMLTPDQFTLDRGSHATKARELGTKAVRVVRNPAGSGVIHEDIPATDRDRFCLTDAQLAELGVLGTKVTAFYGEWPQDIEWAVADGNLYLLQSRDVTGVDFSWDEEQPSRAVLRQRLTDSSFLRRGLARPQDPAVLFHPQRDRPEHDRPMPRSVAAAARTVLEVPQRRGLLEPGDLIRPAGEKPAKDDAGSRDDAVDAAVLG